VLNLDKIQDYSRLGRLLVNRGWLEQNELDRALRYQDEKGLRLGESLLQLGLVDQGQIDKALRRQSWLRTLVAGVVVVVSPVCPVLASEKSTSFQYSTDSQTTWQDEPPSHRPMAAELIDDEQNRFSLGFKYQTLYRSGVEVGLVDADYAGKPLSTERREPQISIFFSAKHKNNSDFYSNSKASHRFDRYKNTIPVVYRLTLKGYSLYEQSANKVEAWGFNKIKGHQGNKYELMFSVTRQF